MNKKTMIILGGILLLGCGFSSVAFAANRDIAIDRMIGGMEEGSRILPPESYGKETMPEMSGKAISPAMDAKVISSSPGPEKSEASSGVPGGNFVGGEEHVTVPPAGETSGGEPAGLSIETDTNVNPDTGGTVDIGIGGGGGEPGSGDLGGGSEPGIDTGTGEPSPETSNPIIDIDASADLDSGTVDAGVGLDTSGELEERQILDADLAVEDTAAVEAEIGSAVDITQQDIIEDANLTTQPVESILPPPSDLSAQVDTTGATVGGETDVGVEADISGTGEGEDVVTEPADGLSTGL